MKNSVAYSDEAFFVHLTLFLCIAMTTTAYILAPETSSIGDIILTLLNASLYSIAIIVSFKCITFMCLALWVFNNDYCDERVDLVASYRNQ